MHQDTTSGYKQPREGITGIPRDDYLLSLDERAEPHRNALIAMGKHLKSACLVGDQAPIVQRMYERITNPQPGDLVVEATAVHRADPDTRIKSLGIMIEHRDEWWQTDDEWEMEQAADDSLTDEGRLSDHAWYIQYGPGAGDVCRWVNCEFTALPIGMEDFLRPVGSRDGEGVVLKRGDLIEGLADSGF